VSSAKSIHSSNLIIIPVAPTTQNKSDKLINMALLNVRSIKNKSFLINDFISENKLHFMFLVETWLKDNGAASLLETCPPNYKFLQAIRQDKSYLIPYTHIV